MIKLLVADDSALMRRLMSGIFEQERDFDVQFARNGLEALVLMRAFKPDVVTLDVHMPEMDGLQCLERIMIEQPCPVVMVSSLTAADAEVTLEAIRIGAVDFIAKPGGALSLKIADIADDLVSKVRIAAGIRLRSSVLLKERVRHKMLATAMLGHRTNLDQGLEDPLPPKRALGLGLVLVGTSTGGPPALEAILKPLPATFPWPIVVAQHMPSSFTGPLAHRLDRLCALTVVEVTRPTLLQAGHVYIGRGDADVIISSRSAGLSALPAPSQPTYPWHPSTDRLVRTAMRHLESRQIIGVLMTGMGNDGADAMKQLHTDGGQTIAEAEETAVVWGMPGELVKAQGASWVVPLPGIATLLAQLVP